MFRSKSVLAALLATCMVPAAVTAACAATVFVSPQGAGDRSGADAANAIPFDGLNAALRAPGPTLEVKLAPGDYVVAGPVKLFDAIPAARIVFDGNGARLRPPPALVATATRGFPLFMIGRGGLVFTDMVVDGFTSFAATQGTARANDVRLSRITADNTDIALRLVAASGEVRKWTIEGFKATNYRTAGIRISGQNASDISVTDFMLDGAGLRPDGHCYRGSVQIYAGASHIRLTRGLAANNASGCGTYHQGDGIEASDDDGMPDDIVITGVVSRNNRDGNFDIKASHVKFVDIRSERGPETRYALRLWKSDYVCDRCKLDGGEFGDLFLSRATVTFLKPVLSKPGLSVHCDDRNGKQIEKSEPLASGVAKAACLPE